MVFIRAGMNAYLDPSVGKLDTIAAEPLRVWRVTGSDEAVEAFRVAVGGVTLPDSDITGVLTLAVVAAQVVEKKGQVGNLKVKLDKATVELTDLQTTAAQLQVDSTPVDAIPVDVAPVIKV